MAAKKKKCSPVVAVPVGADGLLDGDSARKVGHACSLTGANRVAREAGYRVMAKETGLIHTGEWMVVVRRKRPVGRFQVIKVKKGR